MVLNISPNFTFPLVLDYSSFARVLDIAPLFRIIATRSPCEPLEANTTTSRHDEDLSIIQSSPILVRVKSSSRGAQFTLSRLICHQLLSSSSVNSRLVQLSRSSELKSRRHVLSDIILSILFVISSTPYHIRVHLVDKKPLVSAPRIEHACSQRNEDSTVTPRIFLSVIPQSPSFYRTVPISEFS